MFNFRCTIIFPTITGIYSEIIVYELCIVRISSSFFCYTFYSRFGKYMFFIIKSMYKIIFVVLFKTVQNNLKQIYYFNLKKCIKILLNQFRYTWVNVLKTISYLWTSFWNLNFLPFFWTFCEKVHNQLFHWWLKLIRKKGIYLVRIR